MNFSEISLEFNQKLDFDNCLLCPRGYSLDYCVMVLYLSLKITISLLKLHAFVLKQRFPNGASISIGASFGIARTSQNFNIIFGGINFYLELFCPYFLKVNLC